MSAEGGVFGAEPVIFIRLNNVDPRLIFMHRVQNDLKRKKKDNFQFSEKFKGGTDSGSNRS